MESGRLAATMLSLLILIVIGSSVWVGFDAAGRDFSKDKGWFLSRSPTEWTIGCLFLWIIVFPTYLAQRSRAPRKSRPG